MIEPHLPSEGGAEKQNVLGNISHHIDLSGCDDGSFLRKGSEKVDQGVETANGGRIAQVGTEAKVMRFPIAVLATALFGTMFVSVPAHLHGQQAVDPQQHDEHHPAASATPTPSAAPAAPAAQAGRGMGDMAAMMSRMHANDAKLDELVKKMQSAKGAAKTDALADVVAALVDDRKNACEPMMANMMSMMNMMGGGRMGNTPAPPKK